MTGTEKADREVAWPKASWAAFGLFLLAFALLAVVVPVRAQKGEWIWQRIEETRVKEFALSPNFAQDHTVLAGVGTGDSKAYGVIKSSDGGLTWQQTPGLRPGVYVDHLSISPDYPNDRTLFVTVYRRTYNPEEGPRGIFKSSDGGTSWILAQQGVTLTVPTLDIFDLVISPDYKNDRTLLLGMRTVGLFRTTDGGEIWHQVWKGEGIASVSTIVFSPGYRNDRTIFLGTLGLGIFKSTDGGNTWSEASQGLTNNYLRSSTISPNYARDRTVFFGGDGGAVFRSSDGGTTWQLVNRGIESAAPIWSLAFSPNYAQDKVLYAGDEKGHVYRSSDNGFSWEDLKCPTRRAIDSLLILPGEVGEEVLAAPTGEGIWKRLWAAAGSLVAATATAAVEATATYEAQIAKEVVLVTPTPVHGGVRNRCLVYILIFPLPLVGYALLREWKGKRP